ncbi:MAG: DUF1501 domain-containing protein [Trueperaceae bacterium]
MKHQHTHHARPTGCAEFKALNHHSMGLSSAGRSRRTFLKAAGVGGGLLLTESVFKQSLPFLAFAQEQRQADTLVVIFLRGGMDALNAVVPYGEGSHYYDKRPNIAIGEGSVLDLDGFFGFHPSMAPLHEVYQNGNFAVVHAVGSPHPSRSHFDAMEYMERGTPGIKITDTGWLTRHLQSVPWMNDSPFRALGMGTMVQTALQGPISALAMQSLGDFYLQGPDHQKEMLQRTMAQLYRTSKPESFLHQQAKDTLSTMSYLSRLAGEEYTPSYEAQYPDTGFGYNLKQVAQLIKANVGLEVACVDFGGWDTHEQQGGTEGQFAALLGELSQGIAAFHQDMQDHMNDLTLVTMSEFGRRLEENASTGTDHGHGGSMFVLGGGVNGGVYADWPTLSPDALDKGDLEITTDFRDVLGEILTQRLSNTALDGVFPNYSAKVRGILNSRGA